jgi:hypothetical protein
MAHSDTLDSASFCFSFSDLSTEKEAEEPGQLGCTSACSTGSPLVSSCVSALPLSSSSSFPSSVVDRSSSRFLLEFRFLPSDSQKDFGFSLPFSSVSRSSMTSHTSSSSSSNSGSGSNYPPYLSIRTKDILSSNQWPLDVYESAGSIALWTAISNRFPGFNTPQNMGVMIKDPRAMAEFLRYWAIPAPAEGEENVFRWIQEITKFMRPARPNPNPPIPSGVTVSAPWEQAEAQNAARPHKEASLSVPSTNSSSGQKRGASPLPGSNSRPSSPGGLQGKKVRLDGASTHSTDDSLLEGGLPLDPEVGATRSNIIRARTPPPHSVSSSSSIPFYEVGPTDQIAGSNSNATYSGVRVSSVTPQSDPPGLSSSQVEALPRPVPVVPSVAAVRQPMALNSSSSSSSAAPALYSSETMQLALQLLTQGVLPAPAVHVSTSSAAPAVQPYFCPHSGCLRRSAYFTDCPDHKRGLVLSTDIQLMGKSFPTLYPGDPNRPVLDPFFVPLFDEIFPSLGAISAFGPTPFRPLHLFSITVVREFQRQTIPENEWSSRLPASISADFDSFRRKLFRHENPSIAPAAFLPVDLLREALDTFVLTRSSSPALFFDSVLACIQLSTQVRSNADYKRLVHEFESIRRHVEDVPSDGPWIANYSRRGFSELWRSLECGNALQPMEQYRSVRDRPGPQAGTTTASGNAPDSASADCPSGYCRRYWLTEACDHRCLGADNRCKYKHVRREQWYEGSKRDENINPSSSAPASRSGAGRRSRERGKSTKPGTPKSGTPEEKKSN